MFSSDGTVRTLIYFAIIGLAVLINVYLISSLPYPETIILILHIGLFFTLLVPLVYLSPIHTAEFVFTDFENLGGWPSSGVAWCVGLLTCAFPFTGYDGACHMSEETENAEVVVPQALITSVTVNGCMGFGFLIALLFTMGDIETILETPTMYPIIAIFYQATGSYRATNAMVSGLVISAIFAVFGLMASASRTTWAFARDNGLPYSATLATVDKRRSIPTNAIALTTFLLLLLGLINIGSTAAFNAIAGVATVALYFTYMMPVAFLVLKRRRGEHVKKGPWQLGMLGLPLNLFSLGYSLFVSFFLFFPTVLPVMAEIFNWTVVVFLGAFVLAIPAWCMVGRKSFQGPDMERID